LVFLATTASTVSPTNAAFMVTTQHQQNAQHYHRSSSFVCFGEAPEAPNKDIIRSNFWFNVAEQNNTDLELPCVPTLDKNGLLPPGAYFRHMHKRDKLSRDDELKATCRISVAVNLLPRAIDQELQPLSALVNQLHAFVDAGLASFQLPTTTTSSLSEFSHGALARDFMMRFRQETPRSVLDACHFTIPYRLPAARDTALDASSVRKSVLETLGYYAGGDSVDCFQLCFEEDSPYYMDVLDYLQDLQRDGSIRSISLKDFPSQVVKTATSYGFVVDAHQVTSNVLNPTKYKEHYDEDLPLLITSPLAGGWLTDRYMGRRVPPSVLKMTDSERRHFQNSLPNWHVRYQDFAHVRNKKPGLWESYQTRLLETLSLLSAKHEVSIASVILRWTLQLDNVASAVVGCQLGFDSDDSSKRPRPQALRQVFTFQLDDDDMETLWSLTGCLPPKDDVHIEIDEDLLMETMERENYAKRFPFRSRMNERNEQEPSQRKLWL
jgi:diketogulonate reductase-like aldo/keto reductase